MKAIRPILFAVSLCLISLFSLAQGGNNSPAPTPQSQSTASPTKDKSSKEQLPNAPSSSIPAPSLTDLGFPPDVTQGNAKNQALLDKRTHMLKIHQRMGLI